MSRGSSRGIDAWGSRELVKIMRDTLRHTILDPEVTGADFMHWFSLKADFDRTWVCTNVRILGPGQGDASYDPHRLTIFISAERRVTDIALG